MRRKAGGTWETDSIGNQTDKAECLDREFRKEDKEGLDEMVTSACGRDA